MEEAGEHLTLLRLPLVASVLKTRSQLRLDLLEALVDPTGTRSEFLPEEVEGPITALRVLHSKEERAEGARTWS